MSQQRYEFAQSQPSVGDVHARIAVAGSMPITFPSGIGASILLQVLQATASPVRATCCPLNIWVVIDSK
jgi:hypothetical protein